MTRAARMLFFRHPRVPDEQHPSSPAILILTRNCKPGNRPNSVSNRLLLLWRASILFMFLLPSQQVYHPLPAEIYLWSVVRLQKYKLSCWAMLELQKHALGVLYNCIHERWKITLNISTVYSLATNIGATFIYMNIIHQNGPCKMEYENYNRHQYSMKMKIATHVVDGSTAALNKAVIRRHFPWFCESLTTGLRWHHLVCLTVCWYNVTASPCAFG